MRVPPEILGGYMVLSPTALNISGSRACMLASHLSQFMIPKDGDLPNLFTGYEYDVGKYEFNSCEIKDDIEVLSIIPKYNFFIEGKSVISNNPLYLIIFKNLATNEIDYLTLTTYTKHTEGYGYENTFLNQHLLQVNNIIPKNTKLYTSSAHKGNEYQIGVNANVVYMTLTDSVEDAFPMSKSLSDKLTPTGIETISISMDMRSFPINLFGDDVDYKIIPNIGENIKKDGVVYAFKNTDNISIINDLKQENLTKYNTLFDTCYYGKAGAEIVDIDVYLDPSIQLPPYFNQIKQYHDSTMIHYENIREVYLKYKESFTISKKLNTLVTKAMSFLYLNGVYIDKVGSRNKKKITLTDKDKPIELKVDITYKYQKKVTNGFKITGRDGGKGVICNIWDDENMPTDENGFRADLVIDPASVIKRTNVGQLIEQGINHHSMHVVKNLSSVLDVSEQFDYVIDYIKTVNPNFGELLVDTYQTPIDKKEYLDYIVENGIKIEALSIQSDLNTDLFKRLRKKYDFKLSPVSFKIEQTDGTFKKFTTKDNVCIGNKYIMVLYITPEVSSSGIGYVTRFGSPSNKSTKFGKLTYPIKQSCVKFGEDEFRMLLSVLPPEIVIRLRTLYGTSTIGLETMIETLLTANQPSNISHINIDNKKLVENDVILGIIHTIFDAIGVDIKNTIATQKDFEYYQKTIQSIVD